MGKKIKIMIPVKPISRADKSSYSYQKGKSVNVILQPDGTRVHRLPEKSAPRDVSAFDAFAMLDDVLLTAQRDIYTKTDKIIHKQAIIAEQKAAVEHYAIITHYHCQCGANNALFSGFTRLIPAGETVNGKPVHQGITYKPEQYTQLISIVQTNHCASCI
jgi:hypothetical protein